MIERILRLESAELATWETGTGRPILFIHGISEDHQGLSSLAERALAQREGWRRIYLDLPGMGRSQARPGLASADQLVNVLEQAIDALIGDEEFAVVGQSYGAYLVRGLLARQSVSMSGVALIVPVVEPAPARRKTPPAAKFSTDDAAVSILPPAFVESFRHLLTVESAEIVTRIVEDWLPGILSADEEFIGELQRSGYAFSSPDELERPFEGPSVIVCGRQDSVVGYAQAMDLHPLFPRATIAVLDKAGHLAGLERESLIAHLFGDWVDRMEGR